MQMHDRNPSMYLWEMLFHTLLFLVSSVKCMEQTSITLLPEINDVLENNSLQLTCYVSKNVSITKWETSNQRKSFSSLSLSKEGSCSAIGFLADNKYFETKCYSNATFTVTIKHVNISNHGQEWYCSNKFVESNHALIYVQVPLKYVRMKDIQGESFMTTETIKKSTLNCETSEGRPAANITWMKISKEGISTDLSNDDDYNVSRKETPTERNLTIVTSSIDIGPVRGDNGTRIICEATNNKLNIVKKEITINVHYPPSQPIFYVDERVVNGSVRLISGDNLLVVCKSESYPCPRYTWKSSGYEYNGQNLSLPKFIKNETFTCIAKNTMTLPNKTKIIGNESAKLEIHVLFPSTKPVLSWTAGNVSLKETLYAIQNDNITLSCHSGGDPAPKYQWVGQNQGAVLHIPSIQKHTNRTCIAKNEMHGTFGTVTPSSSEASVVIVVSSPPAKPYLEFAVQNELAMTGKYLTNKVIVEESSSFTVTCKADGYPPPECWWNSQISPSPNLTFANITKEDKGFYRCVAENFINRSFPPLGLKTNISTELEIDILYLPKKSKHEWMYVLFYTCGGLILIALFAGLLFGRRRFKRSAGTATFQNVPLGVSGIVDTYQAIPFRSLTEIQRVRHENPERQTGVNESQAMATKPPENDLSQKQRKQDKSFSESPAYNSKTEIIKSLDKIKVPDLYPYISDKSDELFSSEFKKIPTTFPMPCSVATHPENFALNRYRDILPYDSSRVRIESQPNFFINASYIDGYDRPRAYIACLGPTEKTHDNFKSFWKMVWYERSEVIVMVTNLNEPSGMKCQQYWPDASQDKLYGDIHVSCQKTERFADYTQRSFEVARTTNIGTFRRRLVHLHYIGWPDKRTPADVTSLLEFRQKYKDIRTTLNGPVIVHCSAGIGRTGVFIAIDKLIMEGKNEGSVNVVSCITEMRKQRPRMVQTDEQYKFIFKALMYGLNTDFDQITPESMKQHSDMFNERSMDRRYKELKRFQEIESQKQMDSRTRNENNIDKNRPGADIPGNTYRVFLYLKRGYDEQDYINAVYVNSYKCKDHFIMAQSPLPGTESDFLTMIYQENCFCVVSMENLKEQEMEIGQYLQEENQSLEVGDFTVSGLIIDSTPEYTVSKVTVSTKEELSVGTRDFYHFNYRNWAADGDTPNDAKKFVEFVSNVMEYETLSEESSRVLVHCLGANKRSGVFCAIAIMIEKLLLDGKVSVLNTLCQLSTRRTSVVTSKKQVKFCYEAAKVIAQKHNKRN